MRKLLHMLAIAVLAFTASTGAYAEKKVSPTTVDGAKTVTAAEAKALFDKGVIFVDVRSKKDWDAGRIPDAVHIELKKVFSEETLGKAVAKDKDLVIYCNGESCLRSSKASAQAVGWGYSKVHYFRDGFPAWKAAGYPAE